MVAASPAVPVSRIRCRSTAFSCCALSQGLGYWRWRVNASRAISFLPRETGRRLLRVDVSVLVLAMRLRTRFRCWQRISQGPARVRGSIVDACCRRSQRGREWATAEQRSDRTHCNRRSRCCSSTCGRGVRPSFAAPHVCMSGCVRRCPVPRMRAESSLLVEAGEPSRRVLGYARSGAARYVQVLLCTAAV